MSWSDICAKAGKREVVKQTYLETPLTEDFKTLISLANH